MENWRKFSFNNHQIPTLSVPLRTAGKQQLTILVMQSVYQASHIMRKPGFGVVWQGQTIGCILFLHSSYTHWVTAEYCSNFNGIILPLATVEGHSRVSERWEYRHISIFHRCEVRMEMSISRVTLWHHEASPSDAKPWPEKQKFLSIPDNYGGYFFMHLFISCNKMHTVYRICHYLSQVDRFARAYCCNRLSHGIKNWLLHLKNQINV